jgi:mRNA interferase RelE/StbE
VTYEVRIARQAERYLRRLEQQDQQRILRRLAQIAADPRGPYTKPLTNAAGRRSSRVGGWRIIFAVDDGARVVDVSAIGPRGEVYRDL